MKTGKIRREEEPARVREYEEHICDVAGCDGDATGRSSCERCKKDLCGKHQVEVWVRRHMEGWYRTAGINGYGLVESGILCPPHALEFAQKQVGGRDE